MKTRKKRGAAPETRPAQSTAVSPHVAIALAAFALCGLTGIVFSNSFQAGLVFDNKGLLLQDPRIREATRENVSLILEHTYWWPLGEAGVGSPGTELEFAL